MRPTVDCTTGDVNDHVERAWAAVVRAKVPLVRYRGRIAEVVKGRPELISEEGLRSWLGRRLNFKTTRRPEGGCCVPWGVVHLMWGNPSPLPVWR